METANRDDEELDSDVDTETDTDMTESSATRTVSMVSAASEARVSLSKDTTLSEHQAEIDCAVRLIENSKKHNNINTADIAKFLAAKTYPLSVIQHAFVKAGVPVPPEVAMAASASDTPTGKSRSQMLREKERKLMSKSRPLHSGKSAGKASKILAIGSEADWWLPPGVTLPSADQDGRYQEALSQHDIRFCTIDGSQLQGDDKERITKTLPSDKLDQQLRLVMNSMVAFSLNGTPTARASSKKSSFKGKQKKKKKFSIFGK